MKSQAGALPFGGAKDSVKDASLQVMPLQWPATGPFTVTAGTVQLGIAVEPLGIVIPLPPSPPCLLQPSRDLLETALQHSAGL